MEKAPLKLKLGYGIGEIGSQTIWYMINSYLMLFYTDVLTISAGAISIIMLLARVWDAINDPMMGIICDRTRSRWGRFRPYIMFAPPVLAIFNILTFTALPVEGTAKVVLAFIFYIGAGMAYTVCATAYGSIVNVLAKKFQVRQELCAARQVGSAIAQLVLSVIAMPLILFFGKSDVATAKGYFGTALVFSVLSVLMFWITAGICKEKYTEELHKAGEKKKIGSSLQALFKNRQLMLAVGCCLMCSMSMIGRMTVLSYYVVYVMGSYTLIAAVYGIMSIASLLTSFTIPIGTKKMGKRNYMILLEGIMVIAMVILYFVPAANTPLVLVLTFLIGIGLAGQGVLFGMVSDCIDYGDYKFGVREEGLTGSLVTLSTKLATAVVGSVGILLLSRVGYVPNVEQTAAAQRGISFVVNILPAICAVLGILFILFYKLDNKKMADIGETLEQRRKEGV